MKLVNIASLWRPLLHIIFNLFGDCSALNLVFMSCAGWFSNRDMLYLFPDQMHSGMFVSGDANRSDLGQNHGGSGPGFLFID